MPDSAGRLLEVVTQLLVQDGFEGVSVRKVAARAGVSIGAVQHHFPTKDAMLAAAVERASQGFRERLAERTPPDADAETTLRTIAHELLGARPEQRPIAVLWVVRLARATSHGDAASTHTQEWSEVEAVTVGLIRSIRTDRDGAWAADRTGELLGLVDGLAMAVLVEPGRMPVDRAERLVRRKLDEIVGVACAD